MMIVSVRLLHLIFVRVWGCWSCSAGHRHPSTPGCSCSGARCRAAPDDLGTPENPGWAAQTRLLGQRGSLWPEGCGGGARDEESTPRPAASPEEAIGYLRERDRPYL